MVRSQHDLIRSQVSLIGDMTPIGTCLSQYSQETRSLLGILDIPLKQSFRHTVPSMIIGLGKDGGEPA